jgi:hypothetical protein
VTRRGIGLCDPLGGLGRAVDWFVESYRQQLKRYAKKEWREYLVKFFVLND